MKLHVTYGDCDSGIDILSFWYFWTIGLLGSHVRPQGMATQRHSTLETLVMSPVARRCLTRDVSKIVQPRHCYYRQQRGGGASRSALPHLSSRPCNNAVEQHVLPETAKYGVGPGTALYCVGPGATYYCVGLPWCGGSAMKKAQYVHTAESINIYLSP